MKWLIVYIIGCAYVFGFLRADDRAKGLGDREIGINVLVALVWPAAFAFAVVLFVVRGRPIRI